MSLPRLPRPALLYLSVLSARWERVWEPLLTELTALFGPVVHEAGPLPFDVTSYYDAELGRPITRRVLAFRNLVPHEALAGIKLRTNALEQRLARPDGRRLVNLDPGLLTLERLVLATGKNYTHRIYLGQGIWGDLTLIYQGKAWQTLPWSFPDYAGAALQGQLTLLRELYRRHCERERRDSTTAPSTEAQANPEGLLREPEDPARAPENL